MPDERSRNYARRIVEKLAAADTQDEDRQIELLAALLAEHRRDVVCEVIREVRASAHACEGEGRKRAAHERFALVGHLRKAFGVSAGKEPGKRRRGRSVITLKALYERDGGECKLGRHRITLDEATRDHITPLGQGGKHNKANLQLACRPCNEAKGSEAQSDPAPAAADCPVPAPRRSTDHAEAVLP